MKSQRFTLHASLSLTIILILAHLVAMVSVALVSLPIWALAAMLILLLGSMVYCILHYATLRLKSACIALSFDQGSVDLQNRKGQTLTGMLLRGSVVTPFCVVLNIATQAQWSKQTVIVMADSMDTESFRQLRVILKWQVSAIA